MKHLFTETFLHDKNYQLKSLFSKKIFVDSSALLMVRFKGR
jgi:hypothetical protein